MAVFISVTLTLSGWGRLTGPVIKWVSAPSLLKSEAIACPCLPEDLLDIKRTGSIGSIVGPDVTRAFLPLSGAELIKKLISLFH